MPRTAAAQSRRLRLRGPRLRPRLELVVLVATLMAAGVAAAAPDSPVAPAAASPGDRDWSRVQLAWRDDPRPPADLPGGGEPTPVRRSSRRAQRRNAARRQRTALEDSPAAESAAANSPRAESGGRPPDSTLLPSAPGAREATIVHRHLPYGANADPDRHFDMLLPPDCHEGFRPLVVWLEAATDTRAPAGRSGTADCPVGWLVPRGYAVAHIRFRPAGTAVFPAQLDDCHSALETIRAAAGTWGIDPERICVIGSDAGGQLAALVAYGRERDVAAVCTVAAPTHLVSLGPNHDRAGSAASRLVGGPLPEFRETALAASPLTHVTADAPPTLVVHGIRDQAVPCEQGRRLAGALAAAGVDGTLVLLDAGHEIPLAESTPGGRALVAFLDRVVGAGPQPAQAR